MKNELLNQGYTLLNESINNNRQNLTFSTSNDLDDVIDLLRGLDEPTFNDVIYTYDAWQICAGELSGTHDESDYTSCDSALECLMLDANSISTRVQSEGYNDGIDEIAQEIYHAIETACELGYEGDFTITTGAIFGWTAHDRETAEGCAIYDTNLIEGELYAVEHAISNTLYISASWSA